MCISARRTFSRHASLIASTRQLVCSSEAMRSCAVAPGAAAITRESVPKLVNLFSLRKW